MAIKKNQRTKSVKEKMSKKIKDAFWAGYKQGFDASVKNPKGRKFWTARGFGKGYGDKQKIRKIEKRYNHSKSY